MVPSTSWKREFNSTKRCGLTAVDSVIAFLQHLFEFLDQCRVAALGGQLGIEAFQRGAHFHHLAGDIGRQPRHRGATARLDVHQTFGRQRAQCLAHRNARHPQFQRQRVFHQPLAGFVLAAQNALAQRIGDKREKRGMLGTKAGSRGIRNLAVGTGSGVVHGRDRPSEFGGRRCAGPRRECRYCIPSPLSADIG
jgi:hypothetical protein